AREFASVKAHGATLIALGEGLYPAGLAAIDHPPPLLLPRGKLQLLTCPMIAVVGSRNASAAGIKFAERIARDLAEAGYIIVSGLARGIDAGPPPRSKATGNVAVH